MPDESSPSDTPQRIQLTLTWTGGPEVGVVNVPLIHNDRRVETISITTSVRHMKLEYEVPWNLAHRVECALNWNAAVKDRKVRACIDGTQVKPDAKEKSEGRLWSFDHKWELPLDFKPGKGC